MYEVLVVLLYPYTVIGPGVSNMWSCGEGTPLNTGKWYIDQKTKHIASVHVHVGETL